MRTRWRSTLADACILVCLSLASAPPADAGRIVVANDDWIFWEDVGFQDPRDGAQFAKNVAAWFVGSRSGKFLAYSTHPSMTNGDIRTALEGAGHTWNVDKSIPFNLETLKTYDGVFIGGDQDVASDNGKKDVLSAYVNAGGCVYVFSAGNLWDYNWNTGFLDVFGLQLGDLFGFNGSLPINSPHALFAAVDYLLTVNGTYIVDLDPSDPRNQIVAEYNGRGIFAVYECDLPADDQGPITSNVVAYPNLVTVGGSVTLTANVDDSTTGGSTIASADYGFNSGASTSMAAQDGVFDEVSEDVTAGFTAPSAPGVYDLGVRGRDVVANEGPASAIMLVVYDPSAGFVTGGGWIDSPAGAYVPDSSLAGRADFGFVSKYLKGATAPAGNTEFQFKTGHLNFHSSSYDWLVVNQGGSNAQFKGNGTINSSGGYQFMLWATDGSPDTFRIKIWSEDQNGTQDLVYDNGVTQAIGGGSIVIHTK